jgi:hypothetical protein
MQRRSERLQPKVHIEPRARIAPEITDWIIDFLHNDRPTLEACSLICKAWLPARRFHLFSTFSLNGFEATAAKLHALKLPLSTLPKCVRYTTIDGCWQSAEGLLFAVFQFQVLRSLKLRNFRFPPMQVAITIPLPLLNSLTALEIIDARFTTCRQLLDVINAFQSLDSIAFTGMVWGILLLAA